MIRLNSGDLRDINSTRKTVARAGSRGGLTPSRASRKLNTMASRPQTALNQLGMAQNYKSASSMKKIDKF